MNKLLYDFIKIFCIGILVVFLHSLSRSFVHGQNLQDPDPGGSNCNANPNSNQCSAGGADYPYDDAWPYGTLPKPADPGLAWYKLKNVSLYKNTTNGLNTLPLIYVPYKGNPAKFDNTNDDSDWRKLRFLSGTGSGVSTFEGKNNPSAGGVNLGYVGTGNSCTNVGDLNQADRCISINNWRTFEYTRQSNMNTTHFIDYVKTRKTFVETTVDKLKSGSINLIQSNVEITSEATDPNINQGGLDQRPNKLNETDLLAKAPLVLIVQGQVSFNITTTSYDANYRQNVAKFNSLNKNIAILSTKNISFSNNMSEVYGIFIADNISTGINNNLGLKITGNIIANQLTIQRQQVDRNNRSASLFINFNPNQYVSLLPYLSITSYDWKALQ